MAFMRSMPVRSARMSTFMVIHFGLCVGRVFGIVV